MLSQSVAGLQAHPLNFGIKTREAAATADAYVHENPWTAIGVAAGIGLVIGMLGRRR